MSAVATIAGIAVALGVLAGIQRLLRMMSVALDVVVSDKGISVLNPRDGHLIIELPNRVRLLRQGRGFAVFESNHLRSTDEIVLDQTFVRLPVDLDGALAAFVAYVCQLAKNQLSLPSWRRLDITLRLESSNESINRAVADDVRAHSLAWLGTVSLARKT